MSRFQVFFRLLIYRQRSPKRGTPVRGVGWRRWFTPLGQQFSQEQQRDDELNASLVIIDALLAQGKRAEAQEQVETSHRLGNESQNRFLRLQFELVSGRVLLASDHPGASRRLFQRVAGDAHRYGFVGLEFADKLGLAEFAKKTKHGAQAQMELRALQKSASSKGFGLIARKAFQESSVLLKPIVAM